jgi:hypothetical protein
LSPEKTHEDYMPPKKPPPTPQRVMWAAGGLLPSQKPNSMMRCHCRDIFDSHEPRGSYVRWGGTSMRSVGIKSIWSTVEDEFCSLSRVAHISADQILTKIKASRRGGFLRLK